MFNAEFLETPVHDFRGHLVITEDQPIRAQAWADDLMALRASWPGPVADFALDDRLRVLDWRHAAADLRAAAVVVTGRFHGACLALRAGVPFVCVPSSTWDLDGLLETLPGYPAEAADPSRSLAEHVAVAVAARDWFAQAGARFSQRGPLTTFTRLKPGLAPTGSDAEPAEPIGDAVAAVRAVTPVGGSVLHAGAGHGHLVDTLAESGYRAWGTDVAWRLARPDRNRYSMGTPTRLPFADHVFSTVVASADWLDHLELDQLDQAVAELARVGRGTLVVEVSGRALRSQRAADARRGPDWWALRLQLHGFHVPLTAEPAGTGVRPWLVVHVRARVCTGCGRAHEVPGSAPDSDMTVHPALIGAVAAVSGSVQR
jgi:hypothetical protein